MAYDCIGVIGAMDSEVDALIADMDVSERRRLAGLEFYVGELYGREAVVVRSGIGKICAAVCVELLIQELGCDAVINAGVAGSLDARIDIGDIVVATDVVHHDFDCAYIGSPLGKIPDMDVLAFPADETLGRLAEEANALANPGTKTFRGRIASGDQFIASAEKKRFIVENFGALCAEMEGATTGQVAYMNGVPFAVIRAISDKADGSATMDFAEFEAAAATHEVALIRELFGLLNG